MFEHTSKVRLVISCMFSAPNRSLKHQVAYKRFADNVPLAIDHELVRGLKENILKILYTGLRIHGPEGMSICEELAQESPQVAGRREEYLKKLERLNVANQELLNLA